MSRLRCLRWFACGIVGMLRREDEHHGPPEPAPPWYASILDCSYVYQRTYP